MLPAKLIRWIILGCLLALGQVAVGHVQFQWLPQFGDALQAADRTGQLPQNWHLLLDESGKLSLREVLGERALFKRLDTPAYYSIGNDKAVWITASIEAHAKPRWLLINARHVEYLDVFLLRDGELEEHIQAGQLRSVGPEVPQVRPYFFSLPNDGHPREAYIRLQSSHPMMVHFRVAGDDALVSLESSAYLIGALIGFLGLLAMQALWGGIKYRSVAYFWLCLLHCAVLFCVASNLGLLGAWLPALASRQSIIADLSPLLIAMACLALVLNTFRSHYRPLSSWLMRLSFYVLGIEAITLPLVPWVGHGLLAHGLAVFGILVALGVVLMSKPSTPSRPLGGRHWMTSGLSIISLCLLLLIVSSTGYQILDVEWGIGGLFGVMSLGAAQLSWAVLIRLAPFQSALVSSVSNSSADKALGLSSQEFLLKRVSQELRAPLEYILGCGSQISSMPLSTRLGDSLEILQGASYELLATLNTVQDIPLLVQRALVLEHTPINLTELLADCELHLRHRLLQHSVRLEVQCDSGVPELLMLDPLQLHQILLALLSQALSNSQSGQSVQVIIKLEVQAQGEACLYIQINDEGPKLSTTVQAALLRPTPCNYQSFESAPLEMPLALIAASERAHFMKGQLGLLDPDQSGNRLWVRMPVEIPTLGSALISNALQGGRLLIVSQHPMLGQTLRRHCIGWGIEVDRVSDGREALALLRTRARLNDLFDVVILEQNLPDMTGLQLSQRIKADLTFNHDVSLILLTDVGQVPTLIESRNAGVNRLLSRPVSPFILKTWLRDEFRRHPRHQLAARANANAQFDAKQSAPEGFQVLIAEDDRTSSQILSSLMSKLGLEPDIVVNGALALQAMQEKSYDLVLMDCEMPVLDGYEATAQFRTWEQQTQHPHTIIVALTAHVLEEHQHRARQAGMDDYIPKPVDLSQLRVLVSRLIEAKASTTAKMEKSFSSDAS